MSESPQIEWTCPAWPVKYIALPPRSASTTIVKRKVTPPHAIRACSFCSPGGLFFDPYRIHFTTDRTRGPRGRRRRDRERHARLPERWPALPLEAVGELLDAQDQYQASSSRSAAARLGQAARLRGAGSRPGPCFGAWAVARLAARP